MNTILAGISDAQQVALGALTLITVAVVVGWVWAARKAEKSVWKGLILIIAVYIFLAAVLSGALLSISGEISTDLSS